MLWNTEKARLSLLGLAMHAHDTLRMIQGHTPNNWAYIALRKCSRNTMSLTLKLITHNTLIHFHHFIIKILCLTNNVQHNKQAITRGPLTASYCLHKLVPSGSQVQNVFTLNPFT